MVRPRARIPIAAAGRIGRVLTSSADTFHRIGAYIGIFNAITVLGALGAGIRFLALACDSAKGFRLRTTAGIRIERAADADSIGALIRRSAWITIAALSCVDRIFTLSVHALHRIRTNTGVFLAQMFRIAVRTGPDKFTLAGDSAKGFSRWTAGRTRRQGPADASPVGTLIRRCALFAVTAAGRIGRIDAAAVHTLDGIGAYVRVFRTVSGFAAVGTCARIFALIGHAAIGF